MIKVRKNSALYYRLGELDEKNFPGCDNEFKPNRDWWVLMDGDSIIAYCGCLYSEGVCVFVRAWVAKSHRNKGIHKKLIKARIASAKNKRCKDIVTYTVRNNYASANNLIKANFLLHNPVYAYAGNDVMYFILHL
jgi:GNAT superfamily N-acetyltransferase